VGAKLSDKRFHWPFGEPAFHDEAAGSTESPAYREQEAQGRSARAAAQKKAFTRGLVSGYGLHQEPDIAFRARGLPVGRTRFKVGAQVFQAAHGRLQIFGKTPEGYAHRSFAEGRADEQPVHL
jgi:hypothetical protein